MIPDLPTTGRFTKARKSQVLAAINDGEMTVPEAMERYHFSCDELTAWSTSEAAHGIDGLRAKFQELRRKGEIGRVYRWLRVGDRLYRKPERTWHRSKLAAG
jgi:Protein of unknown function (DUF1153)